MKAFKDNVTMFVIYSQNSEKLHIYIYAAAKSLQSCLTL